MFAGRPTREVPVKILDFHCLPVSLRLRMGNANPVEARVSGSMENCKGRKNQKKPGDPYGTCPQ